MSERPQPGRSEIATSGTIRPPRNDIQTLRRMAEDPGQVRELRRAVRAFILAQDERGMRAGLLQVVSILEDFCYNEGDEGDAPG